MITSLKSSDMVRDSNGITQFYLPPTHEPYLPLLPSRRASPPFGWYSLRLPTEGWPGWVGLTIDVRLTVWCGGEWESSGRWTVVVERHKPQTTSHVTNERWVYHRRWRRWLKYNNVSTTSSLLSINQSINRNTLTFTLYTAQVSTGYTLPYRSNLPFLISDIRALWRSALSARVPECQKLKM